MLIQIIKQSCDLDVFVLLFLIPLWRFTKNLSPDKINLSTLKGEGQLSNLELDEEVLQNMLDLPTWLAVTRVYCNKAAIRVRWQDTNIWLHASLSLNLVFAVQVFLLKGIVVSWIVWPVNPIVHISCTYRPNGDILYYYLYTMCNIILVKGMVSCTCEAVVSQLQGQRSHEETKSNSITRISSPQKRPWDHCAASPEIIGQR